MKKLRKKSQPDGWVFVDENNKEIGFARPSEYESSEEALRDFERTCADHFCIMFRRNGTLHACSAETIPEDFYTEAEVEGEEPSSLYD